MAARKKLGRVQQAIVDHVRGLGPEARATTRDLLKAVKSATGKTVGKSSLSNAISTLRQQGRIVVDHAGKELRIGASAGGKAAVKATSAARTAATRVVRKARAATGRAPAGAPTATPPASVVGTKLAPGETLILHVEKDVVHVLENVHGRVEHRKVSRKG